MMDRLVAFTEQISKGTADVRVAQWSAGRRPSWKNPHGICQAFDDFRFGKGSGLLGRYFLCLKICLPKLIGTW